MSSQELESQSNVDPDLASRVFDELIALADQHYALYQQTSDSATFDLAIHYYCAAFDLGPSPDSAVDCVFSYFRLHHALLLRAQGQGGDIITNRYLNKVIGFTPPTHPLRPALLGIRAASYTHRYQVSKNVEDLHSAIQIYHSVIDTIPAIHPQRLHLLMQYGSALHTRFMALKDEQDLDLAIQHLRTVLDGCPEPLLVHARRAIAFARDSSYKLRYDINDIDLAVEAYAAVVDMSQQPSPEYLYTCMGYAAVLHARFYRKGDLDDLQRAIRYCEVVITRCPPSHQHYPTALAFYASLLIDHSAEKQSMQDIDKGIECLRNSISSRPAGDPACFELTSMLGYCQVARFMHSGSAADLESAVENCYAAVSSDSSLDAASCAGNMNRLGYALYTRYQLQGDKMDVDRAKSYLQQALDLCPPGHPIRLPIYNGYARVSGYLVYYKVTPTPRRFQLSTYSSRNTEYLGVPRLEIPHP